MTASLRAWLIGLATIILSGGMSGPAGAMSITSGALLDLCGKPDMVGRAACQFYVLGAAEGAELSWLEGHGRPLFCIPDGITNPALAQAFTKRAGDQIQDRPETAGISAVAAVISAMEQDFPCAQTRQSLSPDQAR